MWQRASSNIDSNPIVARLDDEACVSGSGSVQSLVVHPALLLRDLGDLDVDGLELFVDVGRVGEDHEAAEESADSEDPEEEPI